MRPRRADSLLDKLEVLAEDLVGQSIDVDGLSHGLVHFARRLLHLLVLADDVLLQLVHLCLVRLNR